MLALTVFGSKPISVMIVEVERPFQFLSRLRMATHGWALREVVGSVGRMVEK